MELEQELGIVYSYQCESSSKRSPSLDEFLCPLEHPRTYSSVKWDGRTVTAEDVSGSVSREVEPPVQRVWTRMRMKTGQAQSRGDTECASTKASGKPY